MTERAEKFLAWRMAQQPKIARPFELTELYPRGSAMRVDKFDVSRMKQAAVNLVDGRAKRKNHIPARLAKTPFRDNILTIAWTKVRAR